MGAGYIVHGEIDTSGNNVVLMVGGHPYAVKRAALLLSQITPLLKPANPPNGTRTLPLTWPGVVQLRHTFGDNWRPHPRLTRWLLDQTSARCGYTGKPLRYTPPAGESLYWWQVEDAQLIAHGGGSALITDDPGLGKSVSAIVGLVERELWALPVLPVVAVVPPSMVDAWVRHFTHWAPHWRTVAWQGTPAQRVALLGTADIYVASYPIARKDAPPGIAMSKSPLMQLKATSLVIDECLPAGTPIDTPSGPRPIETLRIGDAVMGVDHATGAVVVTQVRGTLTKQTRATLVQVQGVAMTPEHPVWTTRGYTPASQITELDSVATIGLRFRNGDLHSDVRVVQANIHQDSAQAPENPPSILRQELFGQVADVQTGVRRVDTDPQETRGERGGSSGLLATQPGRLSSTARVLGKQTQPLSRSGSPGQSASISRKTGLWVPERGQWTGSDPTSGTASRSPWLADRSSDTNGAQEPMALRLQSGYRITRAADSHRSGRDGPQRQNSPSAGRQEKSATNRAGLDSTALLQQAHTTGNGGSSSRNCDDNTVYNIETGTENYIAGGLLVHNCQCVKNDDAVQTRAVSRLSKLAKVIVGLSGTPISHNVTNLHSVLRMMYPGAYPSGERFNDRYAQMKNGDYGIPEVLGLRADNEPEFRRSLLGSFTHHSQAQCLPDLPPKRYSVREVEMPAAYLKAYRDFRDTMIAELPDGQEISVTKILPKLTRMQQLAAAAVDVEHTMEWSDVTQEMVPKQKVTLRMPSWKVEAMLEVLEERRHQQSIVFAVSRQLIVLAGAAAEKAGYRVGYIMGGQNIGKQRTPTIDAFQAGELDVIMVVTSAGGVGLTLTAADTEIFLQRPYKFDESVQCEGRAYGRVDGSALESVEIIDIRAVGTNDWAIPEVLYGKAGQLSELLQDPAILRELFGGEVTVKRRKPRKTTGAQLASLASHTAADAMALIRGAS